MAATVVALAGGELTLRHLRRAWPFEDALAPMPHLTERDVELRWRFTPGDGRNSLGLRNREVGAKPPGVARILVLGDSLVWTGETRSGALYTEVMEAQLNGAAAAPGTIEVVNAGIPGYTTAQELEFLERYGLDMEPDLVVLAFVLNDLFPTFLHRPTGDNLLAIDPVAHLQRLDPDGLAGRLFARSYLAHELVKRAGFLARRASDRPAFSFERRLDFYLAWEDWPWRHVARLLASMESLLAAQGARLSVVAFPFIDQVDEACVSIDREYVLSPQRRLAAICDERGWPCLDLRGPLQEGGGRELFLDEVHLNGRGNEIVARELTAFVAPQIGLEVPERRTRR